MLIFSSMQVRLLTDEIQKHHPGISIRSVDGFQGQERELIIFSAVRSNDVGQLGFLEDDKRMNVLLTRARRGLIVIGNSTTLAQKDSTWKKWVEWMGKEKLILDSGKNLKNALRFSEYMGILYLLL
jgi:regulator of nonsense transcripts 1